MIQFLLAALLTLLPATAFGVAPTPAIYESMKVLDYRGQTMPLQEPLYDGQGRNRTLGDWMHQRTPTLLTFNYTGCPMLCGLQQDGLAKSINQLKLQVGRDFQIITVSIDPNESAQAIRNASERMSAQVDADWMVLRGTGDSVSNLTQAAGFPYTWVEDAQQFAHPAVTYVLTESGTISQYFTSVHPEPKDLNWALLEAGNGNIGSLLDQITLTCLQYDLDSNSYVATNIMQAGGMAVMGGLVVFFFMLWRRELARWR